MERKMPLFIQFLTHPIGVYHSIKLSEFKSQVSAKCNAWKILTSCMSLHFSDLLDSDLFNVCGIIVYLK